MKAMNWNKYTIKTTVEAEDVISAMLMELGVEGVEINDGIPPTESEFEAMYIDPQPELLPEDTVMDGSAEISFYLRVADSDEDYARVDKTAGKSTVSGKADASIDDSYTIHDRVWSREEVDKLIEDIDSGLLEIGNNINIGSGTIEIGTSHEDEWRDNWKTYYKPILMNKILAMPEWELVPAEYEKATQAGEIKVVKLNPGTAFGTGSHETTRLSIDALCKLTQNGDTVLDIGTGSGILGIAALKLGAKRVSATEIDPACEHIIEENLELNEVSKDDFVIHIGNVVTDDDVIAAVHYDSPEGYDIVVANILAPVIAELAKAGNADGFLKTGGYFVSTGIIDTKEEELVKAFEANPVWEIKEINHLGDWVSIIAIKKEV